MTMSKTVMATMRTTSLSFTWHWGQGMSWAVAHTICGMMYKPFPGLRIQFTLPNLNGLHMALMLVVPRL